MSARRCPWCSRPLRLRLGTYCGACRRWMRGPSVVVVVSVGALALVAMLYAFEVAL